MRSMAWFRREKPKFAVIQPAVRRSDRIPKDLWYRCPKCGQILLRRDFVANLQVCPGCGNHERLTAPERLAMLVDEGTFEEWFENVSPCDPLEFVDSAPYAARLKKHQEKTGRRDAVLCGSGQIEGVKAALAIMDFAFAGGSMGSVVGENVTRTFERALERRLPVVVVTCTGGARMQEGILSLMQMAKTSIACARFAEARLPYISVLTDPSTAGVMASYASLGDVIIAETGALVGFAGPRVIQQTINQALPRGFQTAEFVRDHGFIDKVVERKDLKRTVAMFLRHFLDGLARSGAPLEQGAEAFVFPPEEEAPEAEEPVVVGEMLDAEPEKPAGGARKLRHPRAPGGGAAKKPSRPPKKKSPPEA